MRNDFIRSNVVFEKEVIFHEFDFETSELDFEVSKLSDKGVFLSLLSHNFGDQLSSNFHRFIICMHYVEIHQVRRLVFDIYQ